MSALRPTLYEVVYRLRYWLTAQANPGADKVRIELHFPDEASQHVAFHALSQEVGRLYPHRVLDGPMEPQAFELDGLKVSFTNPTKWDRR